ncbi:MAG: hypothetical protein AAF662_02785 [Pseudomonadota bacterium]
MQQLTTEQAAEIHRALQRARSPIDVIGRVVIILATFAHVFSALVPLPISADGLAWALFGVVAGFFLLVFWEYYVVARLAFQRLSFDNQSIAAFAHVHSEWRENAKWCGLMDRLSRSIVDASQGRTVSSDTAIDVIERVGGYAARTVEREKINAELERIARA